ncbi:hypothetical protein FACS1894171_2390 [Clostridia bacterium]|nr:hypothetical protein FACS1894171_2390 [Clostridia bacterium]
MKIGKHTAFMTAFLDEFAGGKMSREDFELDYSGYVIEHFRHMERENSALAKRFAQFVDPVFESSVTYSTEDFRIAINNAVCDLLDVP